MVVGALGIRIWPWPLQAGVGWLVESKIYIPLASCLKTLRRGLRATPAASADYKEINNRRDQNKKVRGVRWCLKAVIVWSGLWDLGVSCKRLEEKVEKAATRDTSAIATRREIESEREKDREKRKERGRGLSIMSNHLTQLAPLRTPPYSGATSFGEGARDADELRHRHDSLRGAKQCSEV